MPVQQAIIATPPRNPLLLHMAEGLLALKVNELGQIVPWLGAVVDAYRTFTRFYGTPIAGKAVDSTRTPIQWTFFGSTTFAKGSRHPCPVRRDRYGTCGWVWFPAANRSLFNSREPGTLASLSTGSRDADEDARYGRPKL